MGLIKLKNFCTTKETINKMKRQCTEWEKIFASDVTNNRLVPKIFKLFMLLDIKKKQQQSQKKVGRRPKETFF